MNEREPERDTPEIDDLDVPEAESREVKGGLIRSRQKVEGVDLGGAGGGAGDGPLDPDKPPNAPTPIPVPYPNRL